MYDPLFFCIALKTNAESRHCLEMEILHFSTAVAQNCATVMKTGHSEILRCFVPSNVLQNNRTILGTFNFEKLHSRHFIGVIPLNKSFKMILYDILQNSLIIFIHLCKTPQLISYCYCSHTSQNTMMNNVLESEPSLHPSWKRMS